MTRHTEQTVYKCEFANGACIHCEATKRGDCQGYVCDDSLYATYTKREWVGLTKVQRDDFADVYGSYEAVCAIEQALKERNNG